MIVKRTERLHDLVNRYKDAAGAAAEAQKLSNVLGGLQESVGIIERSLPVVEALRDHSALERDPSLGVAAHVVSEARDAIDGSARSYVDSQACETLLRTLKGTADELRDAAVQGWQSFCTASQHELPTDLLGALAAVDEFRETARRAQDAAEKLKTSIASSGPIPTKAQVEATAQAQTELSAALDAIRDAVPPNIQDLLRACMSREGLPLGRLTSEFRDWMRTHKIEKSFVLRIR